MVEKPRDLIRSGSRILIPSEYKRLRDALNPEYRIIVEGLIQTGARVIEFWAITKHPEWFHSGRRIIDLPKKGAAKKEKMKHTDRTIKLTINGVYAIQNVYTNNIKPKSRAAMNQALKRAAIKAGLDPEGINGKCFRKILISWLVEVRKEKGIDGVDISGSMGHTPDTMLNDYTGMGFTKEEHADMLEFLKGWGEQ